MGDVAAATVDNTTNNTGALSPDQAIQAAGGVQSVEDIPAKFRNEDGSLNSEKLLSSYLNLEQNQGAGESDSQGQDTQDANATDKDADEGGDSTSTDAETVKALEEKGINTEDLTKSFYDNGQELTADWYAKLEEAGYPKSLVDTYVAGLTAQNESATQAGKAELDNIVAIAGGESNYNEMMDYIDKNGSAHAERYNSALDAGDIAGVKAAAADMYVEFRAAEGTEPGRRVSGSDASPGVVGYRSMAEQKAAQADPRYKSDSAYRQDVMNRAMASTF